MSRNNSWRSNTFPFRPQVEKVDDDLVSSLNDLMNDMMHIGTMQVAPGSTELNHPTGVMTMEMKEKMKKNERGLKSRLTRRTGKKNYKLPSTYSTDTKITPKFLTKIVPMSVRVKAIEKAAFEADPTQQTFGNAPTGPIMKLQPLVEVPVLDPSMTVVGKIVRPKKKKKHYMMSKAWVNTAQNSKPNDSVDQSKQRMTTKLQLEHVYGYRAQDVRNNLLYTNSGSVVYIAAGLGVCTDLQKDSRQQRFMSGHNDDILSIAIYNYENKNKTIVATGEIGSAPRIIIWKAEDMKIVTTLRATHQRGVTQLAFSPDGATLASVGLDNSNCLALHNWKTGDLLVKVKTGGKF
jgi:WD40 repeat protein